MTNKALINYIKKQVKTGYSLTIIKDHLVKHGYNTKDVSSAIDEIYHPEVKHVVHHISKKTIIIVAILYSIIGLTGLGIYFYVTTGGPKTTQLLDLRTSLLKDNIEPGNKVEFNIEIANLGKSKRYDVVLKHEIIGTDIYTQETIAVETSTSKTSFIQLPNDIPSARYSLKTTAFYDNKKAYSTFTFNIIRKGEEPVECIENWKCESWQPVECPITGKQTRTCKDLNDCGTVRYKPDILKECAVESEEPITKTPESKEFEGLTIWEKLDIIKQRAKTNPSKAADDCNSLEIESHRDECYYNIAEVEHSISKCSRIISERTKDKCINNIAKLTSNNELCEQVVKQTRKDSCYMNFVNNGDYTVCDKIDNSHLKEACEALRDMPENSILVS